MQSLLTSNTDNLKQAPPSTGCAEWGAVPDVSTLDLWELVNDIEAAALSSEQTTANRMAANIWIERVRVRRNSNPIYDIVLKELKETRLHLTFIREAYKNREKFFSAIFEKKTTHCILSDRSGENICVITTNPTSDNIYEYCEIYTENLDAESDYFNFMVHGVGEISDSEYSIKIKKDDWDAII